MLSPKPIIEGDFNIIARPLEDAERKYYGIFISHSSKDNEEYLLPLLDAMRENNLEPKEMCFVHSNTKSEPSMVLVKAKKGAASGAVIDESLFLNEDNNPKALTERAKKIYEECNF